MGNSGSIHNIDGAATNHELSSYLQAQKNRRSHREVPLRYKQNHGDNLHYPQYGSDWRRSLPSYREIDGLNVQKEKPVTAVVAPQFKVLPKVTEQLHLRATTNGAILQSGGTISGRKGYMPNDNHISPSPVPLPVPAMQRSRTFINDSSTTKDKLFEEENALANSLYMSQNLSRSQTLLHIKLKSEREAVHAHEKVSMLAGHNLRHMKMYTNSEPEICHLARTEKPPIEGRQQMCTTLRSAKANKYKKRKAPEAPGTAAAPNAPNTSTKADHSGKLECNEQSKQSLFVKNAERASRNEPTPAVKERLRISHRQSKAEQKEISKSAKDRGSHTKIPFRREKSCDAILLSRQIETTEPDSKETAKLRKSEAIDKKELRRSTASPENMLHKFEKEVSNNSRIPQLKKTFYFGMDARSTPPRDKGEERDKPIGSDDSYTGRVGVIKKHAPAYQNEVSQHVRPRSQLLKVSDSSPPFIAKYDITANNSNCLENIEDNGLIVRVRPTLPRRQLDPPSFSPNLAWMMLVEEQTQLQRERNMLNLRNPTDRELSGPTTSPSHPFAKKNAEDCFKAAEAPIQPMKMPKIRQFHKSQLVPNAWTPQQDLLDDDVDGKNDDDTSSGEYNSKLCNDGFLFYGSKDKRSFQNSKPDTPPVGLFSLSLPRDGPFHGHADNEAADNTPIFSSLQKPRSSYYASRNISRSPLRPKNVDAILESPKIVSMSSYYDSSNWLLHKNFNTTDAAKSYLDIDNMHGASGSAEPLKSVTTGKHIMYLPGGNHGTNNKLQEESTKINKNIDIPRTKKRQRDARESLQDAIPLIPSSDGKHSSTTTRNENSLALDDASKPFHQRFGFQSTVRLLEKKRLTERLSKDAEEREAQRKSELEALKRVEEEFQQKRANEKAKIRHQMRLYFGTSGSDEYRELYKSLPIGTDKADIAINDKNNNIWCRDEPDGCVSSSARASPEKEGC